MKFHGFLIVHEMDHVIVLKDGEFQFSADTTSEAMHLILEEEMS